MTSNYDDFSEYVAPSSEFADAEVDYFELLSAYIDGEATVAERKQVQYWLDNDPEIKKTYLQLIKLQGVMQNLTVPTTSETTSVEILSERVFSRIDRRRNQKRTLIWGSAIAAAIIGAISGIIPHPLSPSFRMAENSPQKNPPQPMMVAVSLNKPAVVIPKAAVSERSEQDRI